jgi:MSHA pilin protein MshC
MNTMRKNNATRKSGFTMVELVVIIVIIGILATAAAPLFFDLSTFSSRGFADQVASTLRYAQKTAIAQHSYVCVAFGANSVTLTTGSTSACGTPLTSPTGQSPYSISSADASFAATPAAFNYNWLGQPSFSGSPLSISVSGYATAITVEAETGYVHAP